MKNGKYELSDLDKSGNPINMIYHHNKTSWSIDLRYFKNEKVFKSFQNDRECLFHKYSPETVIKNLNTGEMVFDFSERKPENIWSVFPKSDFTRLTFDEWEEKKRIQKSMSLDSITNFFDEKFKPTPITLKQYIRKNWLMLLTFLMADAALLVAVLKH